MGLRAAAALAGLVLVLGTCRADEAAVVETVQPPAWVERGQVEAPLKPGMRIESGDRVRTAPTGRALLRLSPGSRVGLAGATRLHLRAMRPPANPGGAFEGSLSLERGSVRVSDSPLAGLHRARLQLALPSLSASFERSTLWAGTGTDGDLLVLIAGRLRARADDGTDTTLSEPLTQVRGGTGATPTVEPADARAIHSQVQQTIPHNGAGLLRPAGEWRVNLSSFASRARALDALRVLHAAGYPAELDTARAQGRERHRVVLDGFAALSEARALADDLDGRHGVREPWISRSPQALTGSREP